LQGRKIETVKSRKKKV